MYTQIVQLGFMSLSTDRSKANVEKVSIKAK